MIVYSIFLIYLAPSVCHRLSVGIVGGHVVHEVGDVSASVAIQTDGINWSTVGLFDSICIGNGCISLVRINRSSGSRITIGKENHDALTVRTLNNRIVCKNLLSHLHTIRGTSTAAGC